MNADVRHESARPSVCPDLDRLLDGLAQQERVVSSRIPATRAGDVLLHGFERFTSPLSQDPVSPVGQEIHPSEVRA